MKCCNSVRASGLVGVVLLIGLARIASAGPQAAPSAIAAIDDATLRSQIAARLKESAALAPREITLNVNHGVVTLKGTVRTATEKAHAGRLAKVSGVTRIDNRLEVDAKIDQSRIDVAGEKTKAGATKAVDATSDASVTTRVRADFAKEMLLRDTGVDVGTRDHIVTLTGTVASTAAKKRAAAIAGHAEGVIRVVDELVVKGTE